jgi:hypothetical protein
MILNTNNLPWFISGELRTIINYYLADNYRACVLNFHGLDCSADGIDNCPVRIAVDTDGTLILIASFIYLEGPPFRNISIKMSFDFVAQQVYYLGRYLDLKREQQKFAVWEKKFVEAYRKGLYKVNVTQVIEVQGVVD